MNTARVLFLAVAAVATLDSAANACAGVHTCTPIVCSAHDLATHGLDPHYIGGKQPKTVDFDVRQLQAENSSIQLLSNLPLSQIGGGEGSSLYGWVDPQNKREYALMGRSNGTAIVDITNPALPRYVANVPKQAGTPNTTWREPKVIGDHMYIGIDGTSAGMQIVDLRRVRAYAGTPLTLNPDALYTGVTRIHTLAVSPGTTYLYAAGTNLAAGGLHVMDVSNPLAPTAVLNFSTDGYTHENTVVRYHGPDTTYQGRELSFGSQGRQTASANRFSIVDVSNKSAVRRISLKSYPQSGYTHQGWLTDDHRYYLMNDELDEINGVTSGKTRTHFWDVSDLDNPVYKGFYAHESTSIDHNLYIKDRLVYMSNYTDGLQIFALDNLASTNPDDWMHKVGSFDTYLANDSATFNGTWNNYPFFPSGNIAVSDMNGGLFVMRLDLSITPEPGTLFAMLAMAVPAIRRSR